MKKQTVNAKGFEGREGYEGKSPDLSNFRSSEKNSRQGQPALAGRSAPLIAGPPGNPLHAGYSRPGFSDFFPFLGKHIALAMTTNPELFARILKYADHLPPELVEQIQTLAANTLPASDLRKWRDERICQAAALLAGSVESKADRLAALSRRCRRATDEITALILEAGRYAKLPESPRHYRRIIEVSDT